MRALLRLGDRCRCEAQLVGHGRFLRVVELAGRRGSIDPHAALAAGEQCQVLVEAVGSRARRAVLAHHVDVEVDGLAPGRGIQLRFPLLIEPAAAEAVDHGTQHRHVLAPARLAAQADAVDAFIRGVELGGPVVDLAPGRLLGHLDTGLLEEVLAVVEHGAFAIERQRVEALLLAFGHAQTITHRLDQVIDLIVLRQVVELGQPAMLGPDGHFIGADGHDVELATLGRHIGGQTLAQHVLFQNHPVEGDVRMRLLEFAGQALHDHHVGVVDGRDGDGLSADLSAERRQGSDTGEREQMTAGLGDVR